MYITFYNIYKCNLLNFTQEIHIRLYRQVDKATCTKKINRKYHFSTLDGYIL